MYQTVHYITAPFQAYGQIESFSETRMSFYKNRLQERTGVTREQIKMYVNTISETQTVSIQVEIWVYTVTIRDNVMRILENLWTFEYHLENTLCPTYPSEPCRLADASIDVSNTNPSDISTEERVLAVPIPIPVPDSNIVVIAVVITISVILFLFTAFVVGRLIPRRTIVTIAPPDITPKVITQTKTILLPQRIQAQNTLPPPVKPSLPPPMKPALPPPMKPSLPPTSLLNKPNIDLSTRRVGFLPASRGFTFTGPLQNNPLQVPYARKKPKPKARPKQSPRSRFKMFFVFRSQKENQIEKVPTTLK